MQSKNRQTANIIFSSIILGMYVSFMATTAWATVTFVKPKDVTRQVQAAKKSEIPQQVGFESKGRAPEPTTLALFGGGFIGMVMSFVRRTYAMIKRIFDIIAVIAGTMILSPLLLITAVLVKLTSKGPIIYSQVRVGKSGKLFSMYKFRTMREDAEKHTGAVWASANDPRLTPIGKFLRKAHVDELPQMFNILRGEMSLIGPRPERPQFVNEFKESISDYERRLAVKPGLTGLAQVWHRYDESIADVKKKLKYDLLYIKKMNIWADLGILFRTVRVVVTGEGAR